MTVTLRIFLASLTAVSLSNCASIGSSDRNAIVEVEGFVSTYGSESLPTGDDTIVWYSAHAAQMEIARVHSGNVQSSVIEIRYISHSVISPVARMRFRLKPSENDPAIYLVCTPENTNVGFVCEN